ncbi:MAG: cupin domain-containing protein [Pyramidobacter sp.]|jgi:quercetin dioxygenase-like cupin family protein
MIRRAEEIKSVDFEGFKGGVGRTTMRDLMDAEAMGGHGRKFGLTCVAPGASIGTHFHRGESEAWYVLSGTGRFNDDGTWQDFAPGDFLYCADGHCHGLQNTGDKPVEMVALILNALAPSKR